MFTILFFYYYSMKKNQILHFYFHNLFKNCLVIFVNLLMISENYLKNIYQPIYLQYIEVYKFIKDS